MFIINFIQKVCVKLLSFFILKDIKNLSKICFSEIYLVSVLNSQDFLSRYICKNYLLIRQFSIVVLLNHYNSKPAGKVFFINIGYVCVIFSGRIFVIVTFTAILVIAGSSQAFLQKLTAFCTKRLAHPIECHAQCKTTDHNCLIVPLSAFSKLHQ